MGAKSKKAKESAADKRHTEFAKSNEAWNRRVKSAISDLDRAAGKIKQRAAARRSAV